MNKNIIGLTAYHLSQMLYELFCVNINNFTVSENLFIATSSELDSYIKQGKTTYEEIKNEWNQIVTFGTLYIFDAVIDVNNLLRTNRLVDLATVITMYVLSKLAVLNDTTNDEKLSLSNSAIDLTIKINDYIRNLYLRNLSLHNCLIHHETLMDTLRNKDFQKALTTLKKNLINENPFALRDAQYIKENIPEDSISIAELVEYIGEIEKELGLKKQHKEYLKELKQLKKDMQVFISSEYPGFNIREIVEKKQYDKYKWVGICYLCGAFVKQNFQKAKSFFLYSALMGDAESAYYLQSFYVKGVYGKFNPGSWMYYLILSIKLGNMAAKTDLDTVMIFYSSYLDKKAIKESKIK